jgi:hypothetical protein
MSRGRRQEGCALSPPETAANQDRISTTNPSGATHAHPGPSKRHAAPSNRLLASAPRRKKPYLFQAHFFGIKFFFVNTLGYDWPLLTKKKSANPTANAFPTSEAMRTAAA